jgi:hypothetical protein
MTMTELLRSSSPDISMLRPAAALVLVIVTTVPSALAGQAPTVRAGVAAGVVSFSDVLAEQALTTTLEYDPTSWLTFSVIPSGVRVSRSQTAGGPSVSRSGLADLPVSAAAAHTFPTGLSPSIGAGVTVTLPTGNALCGLGNGVTSVGVNAGMGIAPADPLRVSVDGSRSLTGSVSQSALTPPQATWVSTEASWSLSDRWTATLSYGADFGVPDSTLARELGGGVSYAIAGPLAVTFDASHGLTHRSPRWAISIGVGSAFTGTSPVRPTAPLRRLTTTFVGGRTVTTTTSACR